MEPLPWSDIVELFAPAILAAVIGGATYPLVGCFLLVRRTGFYGIALPQCAAAGVAFGFVALPWLEEVIGLDAENVVSGTLEALRYHLFWAALFTFGALALLGMRRNNEATETARVAAAFAIASALTTLFAHASPTGDVFVHELLRGEILAVSLRQLIGFSTVLGLIVATLALFHRDLVLVSYDPEMAEVLGKPTRWLTILLQFLTGLAIATGVMVIGPIVLFGLLVLPPLAARPFARSMTSFFLGASALGLFSAMLGVWLSFRLDWPLGPSVVAAASLPLLPAALRSRFA